MALTNLSKVTGSGIGTLTDLNVTNLTGVAATFTGNVTIGGTLTYDDVTNIDSVGLITARSGVNITGGDLTLGSGSVVKVASGDIRLNGDTNSISVDQTTATKMQFKVHNVVGLEIERVSTTSSQLLVRQYSTGDTAAGYPVVCDADDPNTGIFFPAADTFGVATGGTSRLRITSAGLVGIGTDTPSENLDIHGKLLRVVLYIQTMIVVIHQERLL